MALKQKSKTKQKNLIKHIHKRAALAGGLSLLVILIIAVQAAFIRELYQRTDRLAIARIQNLVVDAVRAMGQPPTVDPKEGKAYLPEARLVLPLQKPEEHQDGMVQLKYYADQQSVTFTTVEAVNDAIGPVYNGQTLTATFDAVPALQACSRQVTVLFGPGDSGSLLNKQSARQAFTKKLSDGRTIYAYQDSACPSDATKLIDYLKTIDSY